GLALHLHRAGRRRVLEKREQHGAGESAQRPDHRDNFRHRRQTIKRSRGRHHRSAEHYRMSESRADCDSSATPRLPSRRHTRPRRRQATQSRQKRDRRIIPFTTGTDFGKLTAEIPPVQQNEDYVLKVLQEVGLVSRKQVDAARTRLDSQNNVVDVLIKDGIVSESDVSRSLAAHAHMDWIDLATMVIPPNVIKQISATDARRFKVIPVAFGDTGLVVAVRDP